VHTLDRKHECACCQLVFASPSRLASHERIHTEGYRYGKSESEAVLHDILTESKRANTGVERFFGEFSPIGVRFLFDFAVNDSRMLEYDGLFHYHPVYDTARGREIFLTQVQSDIRKSRFCRNKSLPLLRLSGTLPSPTDVIRMLLEVTASPDDYSDYVMGHAYLGDFASFLKSRHLDVDLDPAIPPTLSSAAELIAEVTVLGNLKLFRDAPIDFEQYHAAILTIFLRENHRSSVYAVKKHFGPRIVDACLVVAARMPELGGLDLAAPAPPMGVREQMATSAGLVQTRDSVAYCWMCSDAVSFTICGRGADTLLGHINTVHRLSNKSLPFPVKCQWCPVLFVNHAKRTDDRLASHDASCIRPLDKAAKVWKMVKKNSSCGLCNATFGTTHRLLRHFNDNHGAKFSHWMTIVCPHGCPSGRFESVKALEEHQCPYV